jgi:CMP-N,N'-diacetyllegionaminic acid synthase
MHKSSSLLAIIPARGGSKGLPNKNIRDCAGKPLIGWTVEAAKQVQDIDDVIVSTDSDAIAQACVAYGAKLPFMRPAELATDEASMLDVLQHAVLHHLDRQGKPFDYVVLLQPTSPLRTVKHLRHAISYYFDRQTSDQDTLASVYAVSEKYRWLMQISNPDQYIEFCFHTNSNNPRRQLLQSLYMPNGAIFIASRKKLAQGFYGSQTIPYVMDEESSIDIDSLEDFNRAQEILLSRLQANVPEV